MIKFVPAEGANPAEGAKAKAQAQLLQPKPKPETRAEPEPSPDPIPNPSPNPLPNPEQVQLLQRVLAALMSLLLRDYRSGDFHQRAYFRLFSGWLFDLNAPDPTLDPIQPQVLSALVRVRVS